MFSDSRCLALITPPVKQTDRDMEPLHHSTLIRQTEICTGGGAETERQSIGSHLM